MVRILSGIFILFTSIMAFAQSSNINCASAYEIINPIEWCSAEDGFDNSDAGTSEYSTGGCFAGEQNDLWFKFTAYGKAVNIIVNGDLSGIGSLRNPQVVLYKGDCGGEIFGIGCVSVNSGPDIANLYSSGLEIGETYLIRVGGADDRQGTFQLCINNYNPPIEPGQDFNSASRLCDKSSFVVQVLTGGGADDDEAIGTCLDIEGQGPSENQSTWFTWIAANDGDLTFTITPLNNDDIDFVVYEFPNGIDDDSGKIPLRCMATSCLGPTGLDMNSTDTEENLGCDPGEDGFLRFLSMQEGKAYGILINNFDDSGVGFQIDFDGNGEFVGPEADFDINVDVNAVSCDQIFQVVDNSQSGISNIVKYEWDFGTSAIPSKAEGPGPHAISYESFGDKFIVLTVTSDLGCIVTTYKELYAAKCCELPSPIDVIADDNGGVVCAGDTDGYIQVSGTGGVPEYQFNIDGGAFSLNSRFDNLTEGDYEIGIIDIKGCETTRTITVEGAPPILVDAGDDVSVEYLGNEAQLNGSFDVQGFGTVTWSPSTGVECLDGSLNCTDPIVVAPGTTTYAMIVTDENGCFEVDSVTVTVINTRPVFAPNVFSPNDDGYNDIFTLQGHTQAVLEIQELTVFDRWGNKVYEGFNLSPTDPNTGWDGRNNFKLLEQGVYTWVAKILYLDNLDGEGEYLSGDVTLIR